MTTTFADYAAQQDARNTIQLNVTKWTLMLCDALKQNFIDYSIKSHQKFVDDADTHEYHQKQIANLKEGICNYEFVIESGRKYHKIIMVIDNGPNRMGPSRSVHAFVDKKTGQIYKSASWKSPAKGVRYDLRIIEQREWVLSNADWASNYLYAR
jgi:putative cell wall-binding protein